MMIICFMHQIHMWLMNSGYKVLDNEVSKLLSMNFLLLGFGKVGFCEMFVKRGTLQKSGREVLREEIFVK